MKENMRKISDKNFFTSSIKMFICFTIFVLLCLLNTNKVFAVGSGSFNTEAVEKVDAALFQNPSKGGSKTLFADSSALGYYHYGETELLAKYRSYYEKVNGTIKNQDDFIDYCIAKGNEKEKHSC